MKKVFSLMVAGLLSVTAAVAQVEFAWGVSADLVSSYLWRGQYLGGLSIQPEVSLGFEGEHTSLSVGAWGNYGLSDWKFEKGSTYMVPELDLFVDFGFYGVHVGATHYYYFGGTKFFNGFDKPEAGGSQTELMLGYNFADELDFGLYVNAYTYILGDDGEYIPTLLTTNEVYNRYFSTYVELGYEIALPLDFTLTPVLGTVINPYSSYTDGQTWCDLKHLGFTNLSLRLDKTWEFGDHTSLSVFAMGSVNFNDINKDNLWLNTSGEDKVGYQQKLNGCIGVNISFE